MAKITLKQNTDVELYHTARAQYEKDFIDIRYAKIASCIITQPGHVEALQIQVSSLTEAPRNATWHVNFRMTDDEQYTLAEATAFVWHTSAYWHPENFYLCYTENPSEHNCLVELYLKVDHGHQDYYCIAPVCITETDTTSTWTFYDSTYDTMLTNLPLESKKVIAESDAPVKLKYPREIDGVLFDGSESIYHSGICHTEGDTLIKVVECPKFVLTPHSEITVKFTNANLSDSPKLDVNSTGAKPILRNGEPMLAGEIARNTVLRFFYDGENWNAISNSNAKGILYGLATHTEDGLMSKGDKDLLDTVERGANKYILPAATSSVLGGVKIGANISVTSAGVISLSKANVSGALGYTPLNETLVPVPASATPKAPGTAAVGTSIKYAREDHVHQIQTTISGNAATATKFASAQAVTLTGDVTGSVSSQAGWTVTTTLANSGVTAGTYGVDKNIVPLDAPVTYTIPQITVDTKGRITKAVARSITMPSPYGDQPKYVSTTTSTPGSSLQYSRGDHTHELPNSGVMEGPYGPSEDIVLTLNTTAIPVPEVQVDKKGRITSATTRSVTVTLPKPIEADPKDVTSGAAKQGTSVAFSRGDHVHSLENSGVTAGTYGLANANDKFAALIASNNDADISGQYKTVTFKVPYITVNAKGIVTALTTRNLILSTPKFPLVTSGSPSVAVSPIAINNTVSMPGASYTANNIKQDLGVKDTPARADHVHALPLSGVTANTYGPNAVNLDYAGTFVVPKITVNDRGIVTALTTSTIKVPVLPPDASPTVARGLVTNGSQSFGGAKAFHNGINLYKSNLRMTVNKGSADTTDYGVDVLKASGDNAGYGLNLALGGSGNTIIGGGESVGSQLTDLKDNSGENLYLVADGTIYFKTNGNTWANAKTVTLDTAAQLSGLAKVTATTFVGNLSGTADKATNDADGNKISTTYAKLAAANAFTGNNTFGGTSTFSKAVTFNETATFNKAVTFKAATTVSSDLTVSGIVTLTKNQDASGTADNGPALIVGGTRTAAHLEFDANELMAKNNATTAATLYLNSDGGLVQIGSGGLSTAKGTITTLTSTTGNITTVNASGVKYGSGGLNQYHGSYVRTTAPSSNVYLGAAFHSKESEGTTLADILYYQNSTANGEAAAIEFRCFGSHSSPSTTANLGVAVTKDGATYGFCPTPAADSNTTHIATTKWVNTKVSSAISSAINGIDYSKITVGKATTLATGRKINGVAFNGANDITTSSWGAERSITIKDASSTNTGTAVLVNGSSNITLLLPATIKASITGNCSGSAGSVAWGNVTGKPSSYYTHPTTAGNKHIPAGGASEQILGWSADGTAKWVNNYVHPTTTGNKHIPSGGASGQILGWSADGTAKWIANYVHPTTVGNKHIPSGGSSGQLLGWSSDGTAKWVNAPSYTHPTTSGNKHIPSGGSSGQILGWSADGTAQWVNAPSGGGGASYTHPTTSGYKHIPTGGSSGQILGWSADGTAKWINNYTHPTTAGYKHIPSGGSSGQILGWDSAGTAKWVNNYTHPTTAGNKHIPSGGSSGQFLGWSADGTAKWVNAPSGGSGGSTTDNTKLPLAGGTMTGTITTETKNAIVFNYGQGYWGGTYGSFLAYDDGENFKFICRNSAKTWISTILDCEASAAYVTLASPTKLNLESSTVNLTAPSALNITCGNAISIKSKTASAAHYLLWNVPHDSGDGHNLAIAFTRGSSNNKVADFHAYWNGNYISSGIRVALNNADALSSDVTEAGLELVRLNNDSKKRVNVIFRHYGWGQCFAPASCEAEHDNAFAYGDGFSDSGTVDLGRDKAVWNQLYAKQPTIATSDERFKTEICTIPEELLDVWEDLKLRQFKWKSTVEKEGSNSARWHSGAIAQEVERVFKEHNLDVSRYSFFCRSESPDGKSEDSTYALRYTDMLVIEAAYQRRENKRLKERVMSLENRLAKLEELLKK